MCMQEESRVNRENVVRDHLQTAFWTRSFTTGHLMITQNFQVQTFPPFVTFVLSRADLRLR